MSTSAFYLAASQSTSCNDLTTFATADLQVELTRRASPLRTFPSHSLRNISTTKYLSVPKAVASLAATYQSRNHRVHFGQNTTVVLPAKKEFHSEVLYQAMMAERRACDLTTVHQNSLHCNPAYHMAIVLLMSSYKAENQSREDLKERVRILRNADVRGLESRIVPLLKVHRTSAVREILKLQKKLRKDSFRPEMTACMLRRKSLKLSREARQLAFRLAQADRMEAKEAMDGFDGINTSAVE